MQSVYSLYNTPLYHLLFVYVLYSTYIIIKLLSYYYYFIIIFFPHERRGLHDSILVLINLISSSSSSSSYSIIDKCTPIHPLLRVCPVTYPAPPTDSTGSSNGAYSRTTNSQRSTTSTIGAPLRLYKVTKSYIQVRPSVVVVLGECWTAQRVAHQQSYLIPRL